jgi:hypothetical protein
MPHGDGVPNLLKFAFNMDASRADSSQLIAGGGGTSGLPAAALDRSEADPVLTIEFIRRKDSSLVYEPEFSSTLDSWTTGTALTIEAIDDQWERVTARDPGDPSGSSQRFARIRVALP